MRGVDGALRVSGADAATVGEIAFANRIILHELTTQTESLETAFISATGASEEYVAHQPTTAGGVFVAFVVLTLTAAGTLFQRRDA